MLHSDLIAFYASVEMILDPRLRGKAIHEGRRFIIYAAPSHFDE